MPANLTPDYKAAEARFRAARSAEEKRAALEEMLSTIPRHKGTEKLQADLKRRLARLRQAEEAHHGKHGFSVRVEPEGAAQVVLLGPPNAGKSSLLKALTHAQPAIGEYPFTTTRPQPGMMPIEDVQVQLVDLPPVTATHMDPWLPDIARGADAALLVLDVTSRALPEDVEEVRDRLAAVRVHLVRDLPADADRRATYLRTFAVVTKSAPSDGARDEDLLVVAEMYGPLFPLARVSAHAGDGLEAFRAAAWSWLGLVRVYAKPPGKPLDRGAPFVLPAGATVHEFALRVHREVAQQLDFARLWRGDRQGLRIGRDDVLHDGDVVELHF